MFGRQGRINKFLLLVILIFFAAYFFLSKPQSKPPEDTPALELMGTNWEQGIPIAIINGAVLAEGDTIEGYKVIKIGENSVILSYQNWEFELTFSGLSSPSDIRDPVRYWQEEIGKIFEQIKNKASSLQGRMSLWLKNLPQQ